MTNELAAQEWVQERDGYLKGEIPITLGNRSGTIQINNGDKSASTPPMIVVGNGNEEGAFDVVAAYQMNSHILVIFGGDLGAMKLDNAKFEDVFAYDKKVDLIGLSESSNTINVNIPIATAYSADISAVGTSTASCSVTINGNTYSTSVSGASYGADSEITKTVAIPEQFVGSSVVSGPLTCTVKNGGSYNAVMTYDNTSECSLTNYQTTGPTGFPVNESGYGEIYQWQEQVYVRDPWSGSFSQETRTFRDAEYSTEAACLGGETQYDIQNYRAPDPGFRMSGIAINYRPNSIWGATTSTGSASIRRTDYDFHLKANDVGNFVDICNKYESQPNPYDPYGPPVESCIQSTRTSSYVPVSEFTSQRYTESDSSSYVNINKTLQGWFATNPLTGKQVGWTNNRHYHPKTGDVLVGGGPYVFTDVVPYSVDIDPETGDVYVNYGWSDEDTEVTSYNHETNSYSVRSEPVRDFYNADESERIYAVYKNVRTK